jgi:hypothetical protein
MLHENSFLNVIQPVTVKWYLHYLVFTVKCVLVYEHFEDLFLFKRGTCIIYVYSTSVKSWLNAVISNQPANSTRHLLCMYYKGYIYSCLNSHVHIHDTYLYICSFNFKNVQQQINHLTVAYV